MSRSWLRSLGPWCLAATLLGQVGCLTCCHPVPPPMPEQVMACHTVPSCCRGHVYVFLVDGLDPVRFCNFAGLHHYLTDLGYLNTYHGEMYHCYWFDAEIRRIHKEDPDARFVIVGHGCVRKVARSLACGLQDENIAINLLVFVDGSLLRRHGRPACQRQRRSSTSACPAASGPPPTAPTPTTSGLEAPAPSARPPTPAAARLAQP